MEAKAIHNTAMIKPTKARLTMNLIRGKSVKEAEAILNNTNTKAARLIIKVLESAKANAVNNLEMNEDNLVISKCVVNEGMTLKRWKPASRGNVDHRNKRSSHIEIYLKESVKEA